MYQGRTMNYLSANTPSTNYDTFLSGERFDSEPKSSGNTGASAVDHLQWQVWKGYFLLLITFGLFVLAPLNVTGTLQARALRIVSNPITLSR